jgi:hypothetical protein
LAGWEVVTESVFVQGPGIGVLVLAIYPLLEGHASYGLIGKDLGILEARVLKVYAPEGAGACEPEK